jgi:hypothetical protein
MSDGIREKDRESVNREVLIFIFFLILSSLFWYLNELGKDLEATINYPVRYINPPKDRVLTGNLPARIGLELEGPGYSILKMKLSGSRAPVVVDFSKISSKRMAPKSPVYYLVSADMKESFTRQLHADFNLIGIKPDTLFFGFDKVVKRKMPVIPDIKVDVPRSFKAIVVAEPDSVIVTGPKHILDSITGIKTKRRVFSRANETFKTSIILLEPEHLEVEQARVDLEITIVRKYSGKSGQTTPPAGEENALHALNQN